MTKHPHNFLKMCSVLPALIVCAASAGTSSDRDSETFLAHIRNGGIGRNDTFSNCTASGIEYSGDGAVILQSSGVLNIINNTFESNKATGRSGALHVNSAIVTIKDSAFTSNSAQKEGGAIYSNGTELTLNNVDFNGNTGMHGGAIYMKGTNTITGGSFVGNKATAADAGGGAVFFDVDGKQLGIDGTLFENNSATDIGGALALFAKSDVKNATMRGNSAAYGGGVFVGSESHTILDNVTFEQNTAGALGGAIKTRSVKNKEGALNNNQGARLDILNSVFTGNVAETGGGAIDNYFYGSQHDSLAVYIGNATFAGNKASLGGAIYNHGEQDAAGNIGSMLIENSSFTNNSATTYGGAILNVGNMTVDGATFANNSAYEGGAILNMGALNITNTTFENNTSDSMGGAISAADGTLNLDNVKFLGNHSQFAGAILTYSYENILVITNSLFEGNWADGVGAVQAMNKAHIQNTVFRNNRAMNDSDGGGAMFVGAVGKVALDSVTFEGNKTTTRGGAISTRSADLANNKDARLDIVNSVFTDNVAGTTGGALDNYLYSSSNDATAVYIDKATFTRNKAAEGAAIYNHGEQDKGGGTSSMRIKNSSFINNTATTNGGAIFNASGLTLAGENEFMRNTANGQKNDIHNIGDIKIIGGTTTIGGGVTGDGTLTVGDKAVMKIGTSKIEQGVINIDGTVYAGIINDTVYGRLVADEINVGDSAKMMLSGARAGTYNIFNRDADIEIDAGYLYDVKNNGAAGVVISNRAATDVAAYAGLSVQAAATLAAGANNKKLAYLADIDWSTPTDRNYYEDQAERAHPYDKPVLHSMTVSLHNQVADLAAGRMSIGRAGGDTTVGYGAWVQGMHNKSKYSSKFDASTGGISFGLDALINRAYTVGIGYANSNSDIDAHNRDIDVEGHTFFTYAQYKPGKWFANAMLSYTMANYDEETTVFGMPVAAEYDVDSYGAQVMTGYDFSTGITPELGLRYLHMDQDSYSNGLFKVSGADSDFASAVAGIRYEFDIQSNSALKWSPELRAAATYDFLSDDVYSTVVLPGVANYQVNGERLSRMGGEFGIGIAARYNGLRLSVNYELDLHKNYTSHSGILKLKYNF